MRKFLIIILTVLGICCLAVASACETQYYTLTYKTSDGVKVVSEIKSGSQIKKDYVVTFTLECLDGADGEPYVTVNGTELQASADDVYSFKMKEDTEVEVTGVYLLSSYEVTFEKGDNGAFWFTDKDGNAVETMNVTVGSTVEFKVGISVYYQDATYVVTAGSQILTEKSSGTYSFDVIGDTKVTVSGMPEDLTGFSFLADEDGGQGTEDSPFKIRKPVDLFIMASAIQAEFNQGSGFYQMAYYSLENDIDLNGEKFYIIGDTLTSLSLFAGTFEGNNHTISNYYMTEKVIDDVDDANNLLIPYVGFFGFAVNATIQNLNLSNMSIRVDGRTDSNMFVGGLIGYGRGVTVTNCSVNGNIIVYADTEMSSFVGGLIGAQESYLSDNMRYYSVVQSCSSDIDIVGASGYIYAMGGITGYLFTTDDRTASSVLNCYYTGNISGGARTGGIAGLASAHTSIKNCYATGYVDAFNDIPLNTGWETYSCAYAGGIAGYAEHDTVISNSFFTGETTAYSGLGSSYQFTDGIAGSVDKDGSLYIDTRGAVIVFCQSTDKTAYNTSTGISSITDEFIKTTLGWSTADWTFNGNGRPTINQTVADKKFTVTIKAVGETQSDLDVIAELEIENVYIAMSYWYIQPDGLLEFIGAGNRTFGYFFDSALTMKVPYGYIPTDDITLYAKFADYTLVAGDYYIRGNSAGSNIYLTLTSDGLFYYNDGARVYSTFYVFDGENVYLWEGPASALEVTVLDETATATEEYYVTAVANYTGGDLTFNFVYINLLNNASGSFTAVKKLSDFHYGMYWGTDGAQYTFYADGTGTKVNGGNTTSFTFTVDGNDINIVMGSDMKGTAEDGVVISFNGTTLTAYDRFMGTWEKSASSYKQYTFDGVGNWTYEYFGYNSNGEKVDKGTGASGTYVIDGNTLTLNNGVTAELKGGVLVIAGENYYPENSFVGTWRYSGRSSTGSLQNNPIEIVFNGIGEDGYGTAHVSYFPASYGEIDVRFDVTVSNGEIVLNFYYEYEEYGRLVFNKANKTLSGTFYSSMDQNIISNAVFCLYDDYKGQWYSEELGNVEFNGFGNYNIGGSADMMAVRSSVTINGVSVGGYTLVDGTLTGSFVYNEKTYNIAYDEENDEITVECEGDTFTLTRK